LANIAEPGAIKGRKKNRGGTRVFALLKGTETFESRAHVRLALCDNMYYLGLEKYQEVKGGRTKYSLQAFANKSRQSPVAVQFIMVMIDGVWKFEVPPKYLSRTPYVGDRVVPHPTQVLVLIRSVMLETTNTKRNSVVIELVRLFRETNYKSLRLKAYSVVRYAKEH
jgi:hypothetical protein